MTRSITIAFAFLLTLFMGLQDIRAGEGIVRIQKGDTMSQLFGRDYPLVAELNGIENPDIIRVGQKIMVPEGVTVRTAHRSSTKSSVMITTVKRWEVVGGKPFVGDDILAWRQLGLSEAEVEEMKARVVNEDHDWVTYGRGDRFANVLFGKNELWGETVADWEEGVRYAARLYTLSTGKVVAQILKCKNWAIPLKQPEQPMQVPPVTEKAVVPRAAEQPVISAYADEKSCNMEYELIAGAGVWTNDAANGHFYWGEGMLYSCDLGDGYSVGAGFYGYGGAGENGLGYSWEEGGIGPQIGIKRNFLATHTDEFGQEVLYPGGWQIKARYLPNDYVRGEGESYWVRQWGSKYGFYAEYWQRTSDDALYGLTAESWWYDPGKFASSWSGDSPQDRGSQAVGVFAQYRLSDDWQIRPIAKLYRQNWDEVVFGQIISEFRYKETLMLSPWISIPVINGDGAGPTLGITARIELWGKLRKKYERDGRESVRSLGTVEEVRENPETISVFQE